MVGNLQLALRYRTYGWRAALVVGRALLWAGVPEERAIRAAERLVVVRWTCAGRSGWMRLTRHTGG